MVSKVGIARGSLDAATIATRLTPGESSGPAGDHRGREGQLQMQAIDIIIII
jgi:hypothetical protein